METKPFYLSKTLIGLLPLLAMLVKEIWGIEIPVEELESVAIELGTAISIIIVAYGRRKAKQPLSLR